jgi:hypothetical protein
VGGEQIRYKARASRFGEPSLFPKGRASHIAVDPGLGVGWLASGKIRGHSAEPALSGVERARDDTRNRNDTKKQTLRRVLVTPGNLTPNPFPRGKGNNREERIGAPHKELGSEMAGSPFCDFFSLGAGVTPAAEGFILD